MADNKRDRRSSGGRSYVSLADYDNASPTPKSRIPTPVRRSVQQRTPSARLGDTKIHTPTPVNTNKELPPLVARYGESPEKLHELEKRDSKMSAMSRQSSEASMPERFEPAVVVAKRPDSGTIPIKKFPVVRRPSPETSSTSPETAQASLMPVVNAQPTVILIGKEAPASHPPSTSPYTAPLPTINSQSTLGVPHNMTQEADLHQTDSLASFGFHSPSDRLSRRADPDEPRRYQPRQSRQSRASLDTLVGAESDGSAKTRHQRMLEYDRERRLAGTVPSKRVADSMRSSPSTATTPLTAQRGRVNSPDAAVQTVQTDPPKNRRSRSRHRQAFDKVGSKLGGFFSGKKDKQPPMSPASPPPPIPNIPTRFRPNNISDPYNVRTTCAAAHTAIPIPFASASGRLQPRQSGLPKAATTSSLPRSSTTTDLTRRNAPQSSAMMPLAQSPSTKVSPRTDGERKKALEALGAAEDQDVAGATAYSMQVDLHAERAKYYAHNAKTEAKDARLCAETAEASISQTRNRLAFAELEVSRVREHAERADRESSYALEMAQQAAQAARAVQDMLLLMYSTPRHRGQGS